MTDLDMDYNEALQDAYIDIRWREMKDFYQEWSDEGARLLWMLAGIDVTDPDYSLEDVPDDDLDELIDVFEEEYWDDKPSRWSLRYGRI